MKGRVETTITFGIASVVGLTGRASASNARHRLPARLGFLLRLVLIPSKDSSTRSVGGVI